MKLAASQTKAQTEYLYLKKIHCSMCLCKNKAPLASVTTIALERALAILSSYALEPWRSHDWWKHTRLPRGGLVQSTCSAAILLLSQLQEAGSCWYSKLVGSCWYSKSMAPVGWSRCRPGGLGCGLGCGVSCLEPGSPILSSLGSLSSQKPLSCSTPSLDGGLLLLSTPSCTGQ